MTEMHQKYIWMPEINFFSFDTIIDKLETEMKRRGKVYKEIPERFSFLIYEPHNDLLSFTNIEKNFHCRQKPMMVT